MIIVGIDPGTQGAIAWMKGKAINTKVIKNLSDIEEFTSFMKDLRSQDDVIVFHEQVQMFTSDLQNTGKAMQMQKLFKRVNMKNGVLAALQISTELVAPVTWQTSLQLKLKKNKGEKPEKFKQRRKTHYKSHVAQYYKNIKPTLWNADALCLLSYGRLQINKHKSHYSELLKQKIN